MRRKRYPKEFKIEAAKQVTDRWYKVRESTWGYKYNTVWLAGVYGALTFSAGSQRHCRIQKELSGISLLKSQF